MVPDKLPVQGTLPSRVTSFVGRRREKAELKSSLRAARVVTIVGAGGAGKTRLALDVAHQSVRAYPGGCWFVDLAQYPARQSIVDHLAATLRLTRESGPWTVADVAARTDGRELLVVLDNCEHVLDEVVQLVHDLVRGTTHITVLATSRQALRLQGERLLHLDGLSYPERLETPSVAEAAAYESVTLFVERARSISSGFELTSDNVAALTDIARRLEGMPLAIELAAARLRVLSPQQVASRLENQFRLLGAVRGGDERQHTLKATIRWSFDLCTPAERTCWARLSVFPSDFDIEAAEQVAAGGGVRSDEVLELVGALVDKSVLKVSGLDGPAVRYRLSEPVREFGRECLHDSEPNGVARIRHLEHFSQVAQLVPEVLFGGEQVDRISILKRELANLETALVTAVEERDRDDADQLASAIALVSFAAGSLSEAAEALATAARLEGNRSTARVQLLWLSAWVAINQGDLGLARSRAVECRRLAQLIDDPIGMVHALQYLGQCALLEGDLAAAERHCRRALARAEALGEAHPIATVLVRHAQVLVAQGHTALAEAALQRSVSISDEAGEIWCRGFALWNLALLAHAKGEPATGIRHARAVVDSKELFEDAVGVAQGLEVLAWCAVDLGEPERSAVLLGAAEAVWAATGAVLPAQLTARREACEEKARDLLGRAAYEDLHGRGRDMRPLSSAASWTGQDDDEDEDVTESNAAATAHHPHPTSLRTTELPPLTRRETQVAQLVAHGLKNREIADELVISPRTVEVHVEHVLDKLGFNSRGQIRAWVLHHGAED